MHWRDAPRSGAGAGQNCAESANVLHAHRAGVGPDVRRALDAGPDGLAAAGRPVRRDRRQHLADPVRAGRRGSTSGSARAPGRRPREHPRAHPARHSRCSPASSPWAPAARDLWRETGRRRARQGVPMELVLNAYTLGARVLWEALVAAPRPRRASIDDQVLLIAGQDGLVGAGRAERRAHRGLPPRERAAAAAGPPAPAEHPRRAGRGTRGATRSSPRRRATRSGSAPTTRSPASSRLYDGSLDEPLTPAEDRLERLGIASHWHVRGRGLLRAARRAAARRGGPGRLLHAARRRPGGLASSPDGVAGFAAAFQLATPCRRDPGPRRSAAWSSVSRAAARGAARRESAGRTAAARRDPGTDPGAARAALADDAAGDPGRAARATTARPSTPPRSSTATATP